MFDNNNLKNPIPYSESNLVVLNEMALYIPANEVKDGSKCGLLFAILSQPIKFTVFVNKNENIDNKLSNFFIFVVS
ncbi:hypothetical protein C6B38_06855 [Spiroplasma sp. ChiS]|uniref:hypothetical protein n=1 Tax=Spiroplasma sp. ChiS TaxID=2099885 RepID=UPI000CFA68E0|nr:hypothetical protein [Spiroplasma sp. ChiS]PQP78304.1 hypothetical protein C6B38_06855 [Spiroplasma sp. ChiS]